MLALAQWNPVFQRIDANPGWTLVMQTPNYSKLSLFG